MRAPIPLFVEAPAGLAATSLTLQSAKTKPPMARMGSKGRYATAILRRMGLAPGQGANRYVWCDADDGVRALLQAYLHPPTLARAALELLSFQRPTNDERRALWEQLKAQGPLRTLPRRHSPDDGWRAAELARWMRICSSNRLINLNSRTWKNTGRGGSTFGGPEFFTPSHKLASALADMAETFRSHASQSPPVYAAVGASMAAVERQIIQHNIVGTRVLIDPPYKGSTGYEHNYRRRDVVDDAIYWQTICGPTSVIAVCEAEPIEGLINMGWHAVELTRKAGPGSRHFSAQKREWLTMSVPPFGPRPLFD